MTRLTYTAVAASVLLALGACQQQTPPSDKTSSTPPSSSSTTVVVPTTPPSSSSSTTTTTPSTDTARRSASSTRTAVEPTVVVVEHDLVAVRNDVIVVRHDFGLCAPKIQLAFVTEVADGRAPHRARGDAVTGKSCRLDEASACAEAMQGESGTLGELRRQRRACVHWIRVRTCARDQPGQHRRLRSNALAASFQAESVVGLTRGSPQPN